MSLEDNSFNFSYLRYPFKENQTFQASDWEVYLNELALSITKDLSPQGLLKTRSGLYELLTHCIPPHIIIKV